MTPAIPVPWPSQSALPAPEPRSVPRSTVPPDNCGWPPSTPVSSTATVTPAPSVSGQARSGPSIDWAHGTVRAGSPAAAHDPTRAGTTRGGTAEAHAASTCVGTARARVAEAGVAGAERAESMSRTTAAAPAGRLAEGGLGEVMDGENAEFVGRGMAAESAQALGLGLAHAFEEPPGLATVAEAGVLGQGDEVVVGRLVQPVLQRVVVGVGDPGQDEHELVRPIILELDRV